MSEKDKIEFYSELAEFCQRIEYAAKDEMGKIPVTMYLIAEIIRKAAERRKEQIENKF